MERKFNKGYGEVKLGNVYAYIVDGKYSAVFKVVGGKDRGFYLLTLYVSDEVPTDWGVNQTFGFYNEEDTSFNIPKNKNVLNIKQLTDKEAIVYTI